MTIDHPDPPRPIVLDGVRVIAGGRAIVEDVDWVVEHRRHAVLLGPNGAGKTTLLQLVAGYRHAHAGTVDVLGHRIGRHDVRLLRQRIGIVSDALGGLVERPSPLRRLVAAAFEGMTTAMGSPPADESLDRADEELTRLGIAHLGDRRGTQCSEGEWKRALLARALVVRPDLLLLDEPCNGLDLAERERFLADLDDTLSADDAPTAVLVTHHLEQVPGSITDAVLLRAGRVVAAGPVDTTITDDGIAATFGIEVEVQRTRGRLHALPLGRPSG